MLVDCLFDDTHARTLCSTREARDTAGAGDSFRAGVIYGMLRGFADPRLIETASALSAMVCRQVPGVLNSPSEQELERFLEQNR